MTYGQKLTNAAVKAREKLAEEEFSEERVLELCREAATQGFLRCEIAPSRPVDITGTTGIKTLIKALAKQQLDLAWLPRGLPGEPVHQVLEVSWGQRLGFR